MTEEEMHIEHKTPFPLRILKVFWNFIKGYFMMVGLLVTLLPVLLLIVISKSDTQIELADTPADLDKNSVVSIVLDGNLEEKSADPSLEFFMRLFGDKSSLFAPDFNNPLEFAAKNDKVKAVYVDLRRISGSFAQLSELRRAFKQIKDVGKPLYFQMSYLDNASFYLASLGDEISLTPGGSISITGPVLNLVYFADGLKKLGIEFEVFQAGKFKSAMENLIRNEPSEAAMEMYSALENNLRQQLVEDIAAGKGVDINLSRGWLSQSMFVPRDAVQAGIVSKLQYKEQYVDEIKKKHKVEEFVKYKDFRPMALADMAKKNTTTESIGIALIEAVGEIHLMYEGSSADNVITPVRLNKRLKWAREDADVKAVVLRISSPGGSATASDMIWNQVRLLAEKKPVVVSMGAYAASGGYYIASAATKILSEATTITGSIGVIGGIPNLAQFKEKYGVHFHTITGSERSSILDPGQKMTSFDRALIDASIKSTYKDFLKAVAAGRNMKVEEVHEVAQGRVFTGREALELGLVDDIGGFKEAFNLAKELSGLDTKKKYPVLKYKKDAMSFSECLKNQVRLFECLRELESTTREIFTPGSLEIAPGVRVSRQEMLSTWNHLKERKPLLLMPIKPIIH